MMKKHKGQCQFKNLPQPLTVGTVLNLSCQSESKMSLKKNLFIQFPDPKDKYKLKILKVLKNEPYTLDLEVTSYKAGPFKQTFMITDGTSSLTVKDFSFSVQSTLPPRAKISPHPPMGPWIEGLPLWYLSLWGLTGGLLFIFIIVLIFKSHRRNKFVKTVKNRQDSEDPVKRFVKKVRKQDIKSLHFIPQLENLFKLLLEDLFFIQTQQKEVKQIIKDIKKYNPKIHQKWGREIEDLLKELSCFRNSRSDEFTSSQLKRISYQLAFQLEQERNL